jgi:hypothetical protein
MEKQIFDIFRDTDFACLAASTTTNTRKQVGQMALAIHDTRGTFRVDVAAPSISNPSMFGYLEK